MANFYRPLECAQTVGIQKDFEDSLHVVFRHFPQQSDVDLCLELYQYLKL